MNLGDAWNLYKMAILASTKEKSQKTENGRWRNHIAPILGQHDVRTITTLGLLSRICGFPSGPMRLLGG